MARDGRLTLPPGLTTPDMAGAVASLGKLAALDIDLVVAHHGGVVNRDVAAQIRELGATPTS